MIVKENITIYKCEFCNKKLYVKHAMLKHEDYVDNTKQVSVFKCSKLDKLMFPFSIERKKLHEKYDTYILINGQRFIEQGDEKSMGEWVSGLLSHELQHYIQGVENFARGYTLGELDRKSTDALNNYAEKQYSEQEPMPNSCDNKEQQKVLLRPFLVCNKTPTQTNV